MRREVAFECDSHDRIPAMLKWVEAMAQKGLPGGTVVCRMTRQRRTLDQNAKLWPMCADVAAQVEWHGEQLTKEGWKDLFTGSLKGQKPVHGIGGTGLVFIGGGSSKLTVREFSDLIEFIYSFGSDRDVKWSEPSKDAVEWAKSRREKV